MTKFISYAQNFEDVMLWRALNHVENGFFVDVGANDPVNDSVTKAFSNRGWRGINIEPVSHWYAKLLVDRPDDINLQVAASSDSGTIAFFEVIETGLSTAQENIAKKHAADGYKVESRTVPTITLSEVFKKHQVTKVHFLKIDVEGAEEAVLRGLDFGGVRPWVIVVEATEPNSTIPSFQKWEPLLLNNGYLFVYFDGLNRFYLSKDHPELRPAFDAPPNVRDNFIQYPSWLAEKEALDQLEICRSDLKASQDHMTWVLNSFGWRITKPLRAPGIILRRMRQWFTR